MIPSLIKPEIQERYLFGGCLSFAVKLNELIDGELYLIITGKPDTKARINRGASHVVVKKNGMFWDISGGYAENEIKELWKNCFNAINPKLVSMYDFEIDSPGFGIYFGDGRCTEYHAEIVAKLLGRYTK